MTLPTPKCKICNREMVFNKDADWDAGYWCCEKEHTRNGIGISTAIAHEDAQADYIATLEAENAALKAQIEILELSLENLGY